MRVKMSTNYLLATNVVRLLAREVCVCVLSVTSLSRVLDLRDEKRVDTATAKVRLVCTGACVRSDSFCLSGIR
jgi:hypothetical protein